MFSLPKAHKTQNMTRALAEQRKIYNNNMCEAFKRSAWCDARCGCATESVLWSAGAIWGPRTLDLFTSSPWELDVKRCCFYIVFTRFVRETPYNTCVKSTCCLVDNPPGMVSGEEEEQQQQVISLQTALALQSNRLSLAHTASPRLARSHARTKRNDFPVAVSQRTHPPNLQYIYIESC